MSMPLKSWFGALLAALLLAACGDGSVRSPELIGPGGLLNIQLRCQTAPGPNGPPCAQPPTVFVGGSVHYRVLGTFEDGSTRDITAQDRIALNLGPAGTSRGSLTPTGPEKGRVRGNAATEDGAPLSVTAADTQGEADPARDDLIVVGGTPESIDVLLRDSAGRLDGFPFDVAPSGVPQQFVARVNFAESAPDLLVSSDPQLVWSAELVDGQPDDTGSITQNGVFTGTNTSPDLEEADNSIYAITARFRPEPDDPSAPQFSPIQSTEELEVGPASYVDDSFRLEPAAAQIVEGQTVTFRAFASFQTGEAGDGTPVIVEAEITQALETLGSDGPEFVEFQESDAEIDNVLVGLSATPEGLPVTVTATFRGETDTSQVVVLEPDFAQLALVPVGVAPFEAAGLFNIPGADEEAIQERREQVANDALLLGLNENGQIPTCEYDPSIEDMPEDCPNAALPLNQTLPGVSLSYVVVARLQGSPEFGEDGANGILLQDFTAACDDDSVLSINFDGGDSVIDIATLTDPEGEDVEPEPLRTASGARYVRVDGLSEGESILRARLGVGFEGDATAGLNCRSEEVEDAETDVVVGLDGGNGQIEAVDRTTFNINRNFGCQGFINAEQLLADEGVRARGEKLIASLTYDVGEEGMTERRVIVPINQQRIVDFRTVRGPAQTPEQLDCRNEDGTGGPPAISITNALDVERGLVFTDSPISLDTNCAAADLIIREGVTLPGLTNTLIDEDPEDDILPRTTRAASYVLLPVDDAILGGDSAISSAQIDELCDGLEPLLTLPLGPAVGLPQGAGLPVELISGIGAILSPILNSEPVQGPVADGLELLLNSLGDLVNGLLDVTGLGDLLIDPLLGILGIGDDSPVGISLLASLIDGLGLLLDELKSAIGGAIGLEDPPATADPGDPFVQEQMEAPDEGEEGEEEA